MLPKTPNTREKSYYKLVGTTGNFTPIASSYYYDDNLIDWQLPQSTTVKNPDGSDEVINPIPRKGKLSIFNRYSIFYFNSVVGQSTNPEDYIDKPNRLGALDKPGGVKIQSIIENPTAKNIINWSKQGGADRGTNAIEYDWEDFLWCKNYGTVPNNYMVTLRRFPIPVSDDLTDPKKQPSPDISRLIAWVDGESNTWESVGLKFSTSMNWRKLESEIQKIDRGSIGEIGNEGALLSRGLGNIVKQASFATQPGSSSAALGPKNSVDPYANKNVVYGPIDVIKEMMIRDTGLNFAQEFNLKFEYELLSIDGINPKVAMMDLISNVLICTANRADFWGGDIRYFGGDPRRVQPLGDTSRLQKGDLGGYFKSILGEMINRLGNLTDGNGFSLEGLANAAKNIGGNLMNNMMGGSLDKMGRPGAMALNALLSGEDTGEWHVMVGNPANPIVSVGNLILENTEIEFAGALGPDDFPNKLIVTCKLKPARPRDRTDILSIFHKNGRTVLSTAPSSDSYAGNLVKGGNPTSKPVIGDHNAFYDENQYFKDLQNKVGNLERRFPNHKGLDSIIDNAAQGIY